MPNETTNKRVVKIGVICQCSQPIECVCIFSVIEDLQSFDFQDDYISLHLHFNGRHYKSINEFLCRESMIITQHYEDNAQDWLPHMDFTILSLFCKELNRYFSFYYTTPIRLQQLDPYAAICKLRVIEQLKKCDIEKIDA